MSRSAIPRWLMAFSTGWSIMPSASRCQGFHYDWSRKREKSSLRAKARRHRLTHGFEIGAETVLAKSDTRVERAEGCHLCPGVPSLALDRNEGRLSSTQMQLWCSEIRVQQSSNDDGMGPDSPKLLADAFLSRPYNRILLSCSEALFALRGHRELRRGQGLPPLPPHPFRRWRQSSFATLQTGFS